MIRVNILMARTLALIHMRPTAPRPMLYTVSMVNYSKTSNSLSYGGTYYHYDNWNSTYNDYLSEWVERGFKACDLINILINQYCKSAFGSLF